MKKGLFISLLLLIAIMASGQNFNQFHFTFNTASFSPCGSDVQFDDTYVVTGCIGSGTTSKMPLIKIDTSGNVIYGKILEGNSTFGIGGHSVAAAPDSGLFASANLTDSNYKSSLMIMHFDQAGNQDWTKTYGFPNGISGGKMTVTPSGNLIVLGGTRTFALDTTNNGDAYIMKLDPNGDTLWTRVYGDQGYNDRFSNARVLANGDLLVSGIRRDPSLDRYNCIYRLTSNGDLIWARAMNNIDVNEISGIDEDLYGNLYFTGGMGEFNSLHTYLLKLKADGTEVFFKKIRPWPAGLIGKSIIVTKDNDPRILIGASSSGLITSRTREGIFELDSNGTGTFKNLQMTKNASDYGELNGMGMISNGDILICGRILDGASSEFYPAITRSRNDVYINCPTETETAIVANDSSGLAAFTPGIVSSGGSSGNFTISTSTWSGSAQITCPIVSRSKGIGPEKIEVYPNPFYHQLTIRLPEKRQGPVTIQFFDLGGKLILQNKQSFSGESFVVNTESLKPGMYFCRLSANGLEFSRLLRKD